LLGVHRGNGHDGPPRVDQFSTWLGRQVDIAVGFQGDIKAQHGWAYVDGPIFALEAWRSWLQAKPGRKLSYQVSPFPQRVGHTLAQVANGDHDAHYVTLANNLARYGMLDIELRIGHEMDGGWYEWGAPSGSGKEASYAAAFRRIVTVMRRAQPSNKWKIVWNPTSDTWPLSAGAAYFERLWPGDGYVDQVGIDCYDKSFVTGKVYYPSGSDRLQRQKEVWAAHHARLVILRDFAAKHGKPLQFPEWGLMTYDSTYRNHEYGGGDNPYFIQKMHEFFMDPANRVVMQAYFDTSNSLGDHRVGPSRIRHPLASAKYRELFGSD